MAQAFDLAAINQRKGWRVARAFDLAGISNTVGAPSFALFLRRAGIGNARVKGLMTQSR
jgi:hypothetical protein